MTDVHAVYVPLSPVQRWWYEPLHLADISCANLPLAQRYKRLLTRMDSLTLGEIFPKGEKVDAGVRANVQHAMGSQTSQWKAMNHLCGSCLVSICGDC